MSDANTAVNNLRERLAGSGEDRLGKALSELLDNSLLSGAIGRAFDAREKAAQAQELAMGALNIPSAADIERLTRRLRSVSQRLEGIEDGVHRLDRTLAARGLDPAEIGERLEQIEEQLDALTKNLRDSATRDAKARAAATKPAARRSGGGRGARPASKTKAKSKRSGG